MKDEKLRLSILALLLRDAGRKRLEIARDLGISEASLSKKISDLVYERVIRRTTIDIDYTKLGYGVGAISLIILDNQADLREVEEYLKRQKSAVEYAMLLGKYDLLVRWLCRDAAQLTAAVGELAGFKHLKIETLTVGERHLREVDLFNVSLDR